MNIRELAKRKNQALAAVHKTDEELHEMAEDYSKNVGAGTIAGPKITSGISNIGKGLENNSLRALVKKIGPKAEEALNKALGMSSDTKVKAEFVRKLEERLKEIVK